MQSSERKRFSIGYDNHSDWTVPVFLTYDEAYDYAGKRVRMGDGPVVVIEWVDGKGLVTRCRRMLRGGNVVTRKRLT